MGIVYLRAKFCCAPVKKAWVKKNPEIQKTGGASDSYQSLRRKNQKMLTYNQGNLSIYGIFTCVFLFYKYFHIKIVRFLLDNKVLLSIPLPRYTNIIPHTYSPVMIILSIHRLATVI